MLICLALNNEETKVSFEYMYAKYKNAIYYRICKSETDVQLREDVMQEIFRKFSMSMGKIQGEDAAVRWLMTIARNEIINHGKKEAIYRRNMLLDMNCEDIVDVCSEAMGDATFDAVQRKELSEKVKNEIKKLKPIHSEVILLKYYLGFTPDEIAKMLRKSVNTIYSRLSRGEEILYNALYDYVEENFGMGGVQDGQKVAAPKARV